MYCKWPLSIISGLSSLHKASWAVGSVTVCVCVCCLEVEKEEQILTAVRENKHNDPDPSHSCLICCFYNGDSKVGFSHGNRSIQQTDEVTTLRQLSIIELNTSVEQPD